jgi:hypothetical protein
MALQQPQRRTPGKNAGHLRVIGNQPQVSEQPRYVNFGALLRSLRDRVGYTVEQVIEQLAPFFQGAQVPELGVKTYGNLERDERYPHYQELWPLFRGLVEGCQIQLAAQDGQDFYDLARQKISASKKWHRPEANWQDLKQRIAEYTGVHQEVAFADQSEATWEIESAEGVKKEERQRNLHQLDQDTSHILGRDDWLEYMFSYLEQKTTTRKKVIVIQAALGAGKTSCMKLLQKRLFRDAEDAHVIHHECKRSINLEPSRNEKTPEEHLDVLLAHILNDLQPQQAERYEAPSTMERIRLALQAICEVTTPLVILIDDAQVLLEPDGELYSGWQQFLNEVIEHNHHASLFIATREWPGWTERKDSYLVQTDLEALSPETCIQVWKQLGYVDEQEAILRQAAHICEYNPRMMEIVAQNVEKPLYSFGWSNWRGTMRLNEQQGLARFVEDPHYLSNAMLDAYPLLDEIITTRLSPDTRKLLAILAVAPVSLPAPLLIYLTEHPKRCVKELMRTSLLARDPDRLRLLPLVAESALQQLSEDERVNIEACLITAYQHWMREGGYRDEQEQAAVITELMILYLKRLQLLEAAELVVEYGWLSFQFGYASRVTRIVQQVMEGYDSKRLTPQQDIAAQLLHCRLAKHRGEKLTTKQRGQIYQQLYTRAEEEHTTLSSAIEIYLMRSIVISLADNAQFEDAQALVNGQLSRIKSLQENDSTTYESYLYYQAYLLAKWGEHKEDLARDQQILEEAGKSLIQAREYFEKAASLYKQCADLLRRSLRGAAPIERSSISYKLARRLNDYAHYARRSKGKFEDIEDALQKSIDLKRQGYTLPVSLPGSYSEYAQFFASTGQYQRASEQSDLALQQMEQLVQEGYSSAKRELAVLQIERAQLHLLLGNLDEAQQLFELSKEYVQKSVRRKQFARKVEEGMRTIEQIRAALPGGLLRGQLDYRWIGRYKEIADYDTFWWLEPSGPFTEDERYEWSRLLSQSELGEASDDLKLLLKTALQRELDRAVKEQRNPHLTYPAIPIDLVRQKASDGLKLRNDVENEEPNIVVKSLYLGALDEHLDLLRLIEACYLGDPQAYSLYNDRLNPAPTAQEMEIAAQELVRILKRGMASEQTALLSQKIFRTLQDLSLISPYRDLAKEYSAEEHKPSLTDAQQDDEVLTTLERFEGNPLLSIDAVKAFFDSAFSTYGFDDWCVKLDPSALNTRVEQNTHELILPKKSMRLDKILHLLAHEIECHIYRSANGERSKLSLLGYGTANYLPTEEAFATLYSAQAEGKKGETPWIGTLAVGLASGSRSLLGGKVRPQNFYELYSIMHDYHQLNLMLSEKDTEAAKRTAHRLALSRCVRTWRGVPAPLPLGICFTKDNCYLRGYLLLQQELKHAQRNSIDLMERLQVGAIGVEHVQACEQLGIIKPIVAHKRLAFNPQIRQYIVAFQGKAQALDSATFSPLGIENE